MENLEEKLKYYADNYYNGNELISDEEYDSLVSQLKKENQKLKNALLFHSLNLILFHLSN